MGTSSNTEHTLLPKVEHTNRTVGHFGRTGIHAHQSAFWEANKEHSALTFIVSYFQQSFNKQTSILYLWICSFIDVTAETSMGL